MESKSSKVKLAVSGRVECRGIQFSGDILGLCHEFLIEGHLARVCLPAAQFDDEDVEPKGENSSVIHPSQYNSVNPTPNTSYYGIEFLTIEIDINEDVTVPICLLETKYVDKFNGVSDHQRKLLDNLSDKYSRLLVSAWRHWLSVTKWATGRYGIGLSSVSVNTGSEPLSLVRLFDKDTGFDVWNSPTVIKVRMSSSVDANIWSHIGNVLASGDATPVWIEYLAEAKQRLSDRDFSGCVLTCAIACETIARAAFFHLTGKPSNEAAAELIDRIAVQAIIGRWEKLTSQTAVKGVHQIFDLRNSLVHSGRIDTINADTGAKCYKNAQKFVEQADKWYFEQISKANPRLITPSMP